MVESREHLQRQFDLINSDILETPITVIGAGAIGSFTVLNLAKMGFTKIAVYDFDEVDIANMNSQFYRFSDIGKPKVSALRDLVKDFTGVEIFISNSRYESGTFPGVVISAVDSMAVRKLVFDNHKYQSFETQFLIDPRMGAETAMQYVVRPMVAEEVEVYEKTLYSDESAVQERCTAKATIYTATMLSGLVSKTVKQCLMAENYSKNVQWCMKTDDLLAWKQQEDQAKRPASASRDEAPTSPSEGIRELENIVLGSESRAAVPEVPYEFQTRITSDVFITRNQETINGDLIYFLEDRRNGRRDRVTATREERMRFHSLDIVRDTATVMQRQGDQEYERRLSYQRVSPELFNASVNTRNTAYADAIRYGQGQWRIEPQAEAVLQQQEHRADQSLLASLLGTEPF